MPKPALTVVSLGLGVQSSTLAAMVALGALPAVDVCLFADTGHERAATYEFARWLLPWLAEHGVEVVTVQAEDQSLTPRGVGTLIPAYTLAQRGTTVVAGKAVAGGTETAETAEATEGQVRRQCTGDWKIAPMRRWISAELERRGLTKTAGVVEQWLGISRDEGHRAKASDVAYISHRYPLLELGMTRGDCVAWLKAHDLPIPGKSACVFCPYHTKAAWEQLKREGGPDWDHALEVDTLIRDARPPFPLFVHRRRVPLDQAVVIPEDQGLEQGRLFAEETPCDSGYCFL